MCVRAVAAGSEFSDCSFLLSAIAGDDRVSRCRGEAGHLSRSKQREVRNGVLDDSSDLISLAEPREGFDLLKIRHV